MINKVALIRFDSQAGAWTDETNWVKGSIIRRFAKERMGKKQLRGRLSKAEISAYWLDAAGNQFPLYATDYSRPSSVKLAFIKKKLQ